MLRRKAAHPAWDVRTFSRPATLPPTATSTARGRRPMRSEPNLLLRDFLQERWKGMTPILWGQQLRQERLDELIYLSLMNADHLPGADETSPMTDFYRHNPCRTDAAPTNEAPSQDGVLDQCLIFWSSAAGLTGLTAALTAAQAGLSVRVVAKGMGALHWSAGTVDVLGYALAGDAIERPLSEVERASTAPSLCPGRRRACARIAGLVPDGSGDRRHLIRKRVRRGRLARPQHLAAVTCRRSAAGLLGPACATARRPGPGRAHALCRSAGHARFLPGADRRQPDAAGHPARAAAVPVETITRAHRLQHRTPGACTR